MAQLTIRLLGNPEIAVDGQPIEVDTRKAIALLAYLAVEQRTLQRDYLAALFWPESDQTRARSALRRTLATVNKAVGKDWLNADRSTIALDPDAADNLWIDVGVLSTLAAALGEWPANEPDAQAALEEALALYRGRFMQGFTLAESAEFDDWQAVEAERLARLAGKLYQKLVSGCLLSGAADAAVRHARRWVALDPLHEPARRALITALAQAGQRSAALRQSEEFAQLLDEELGVEPEDETLALVERVRSGELGAAAVALPPAPAPSRPLHNLPQHMTSFIGRDAELREIEHLLERPECRLVTLTGPGGIGKTRLALEAAAGQIGRWEQGVFFVPLAPVESIELVVPTIADALYFTFYGRNLTGEQLREQLYSFLANKHMLIVLDNCEHLVVGLGLITTLLQRAPHVKILATSQERLNLREEWVVEVHGLTPPPADQPQAIVNSSACQLFVQRARQVNRDYTLADAELPHVARLVQLVGGTPLGIELAATWVRLLGLPEIVEQITRDLDFLTVSVRNLPDRHRSLRAVFEHSWRMLPAEERSIMQRLAVMRGGFAPADALALAGAAPRQLMTLVDKSLIQRDAAGLYEVPTVLHGYVREKAQSELGWPAILRAHADYFTQFLAARTAALKGRGQKQALSEIGAAIENIRLAWRTATEQQMSAALWHGLASLFLFYEVRSWFEEGANIMQSAAQQIDPQQEPALHGALLMCAGAFNVHLARYDDGAPLLERAVALLRDYDYEEARDYLAQALRFLGMVAEGRGDRASALALHQESLMLSRQTNNRWGMANALNAQGNVYLLQRDYDNARRCYEESQALRQEIGDRRGISLCAHNLGHIQHTLGNLDAAEQLYQESVQLKREFGALRGIAYSLNNLGHVNFLRKRYAEARATLQDCYAIFDQIGDLRGAAYALTNLGNVAMAEEDYAQAERHYVTSQAIFERIGDRMGIAFSLEDLGNVALRQGRYQEARRYLHGALAAADALGAQPIVTDALLTLAELHLLTNDEERAAIILASVRNHPNLSQEGQEKVARLSSLLPAREPVELAALVSTQLVVA